MKIFKMLHDEFLYDESLNSYHSHIYMLARLAITYATWLQATENVAQQREQQLGRGLTLDERRQAENEAYEQLVTDVLLQQEIERRGIRVTDEEIRLAAQTNPPPGVMASPDLQTDGRFDPAKYLRFLSSPAAKQSGMLVQLENYYRSEIPKQKLLEQATTGVYVTDGQLWQLWQDQRDSAVISFVAWRPGPGDTTAQVSDEEVRAFYERNSEAFDRPGRAVVSLIQLPRTLTAADTQATRARALQLREEIQGGTSFEDVAQRESADTASAVQGGSLGRVDPSMFVEPFAQAARALPVGQLSEPVLTQFGYHIIRVDERKGDTLALRHILLPITQRDSAATALDRRADSLANLAASAQEPARFDSAARTLQLPITQLVAFEGEPLTANGRYVPDVSAWAFSGATVGETNELVSGDDGYYLARLDSLHPGGKAPLADVRDEIRRRLAAEKAVQQLVPRARELAQSASRTSLEQAAQAAGLTITTSEPFTRTTFVPGVGNANEAVGAAFTLPVGRVSAPIATRDGVFVLRVDRRAEADSAAWVAVKEPQRLQVTQALRQARAAQWVQELRRSADVEDKRADVRAALRAQS
jgi:peptidyl-prolyl cis-trans isomerase D